MPTDYQKCESFLLYNTITTVIKRNIISQHLPAKSWADNCCFSSLSIFACKNECKYKMTMDLKCNILIGNTQFCSVLKPKSSSFTGKSSRLIKGGGW